MELFSVNRYTEEAQPVPEENNILSNLLGKVEKRKRKRSLEKQEASANKKEIKEQNVTAGKKETPRKTKHPKNDLEEKSTKLPNSPTEEENNVTYEVLGDDADSGKKGRKQKTDIVLPSWLAHPTIISMSLTDTTEEGDLISKYPYLATHVVQSLKEMNVTRFFPVQSSVIPWILEAHNKPPPFRPRDICVSAPTGSGKTLAFAIPVVQALAAERVDRKVRALVVLPVAELAQQVFKVFKKLCEKTDLSVLLFSQQATFAMEQKNLVDFYKGAYYSKVDIVVTTPGRLVDHLHATKGFCLKSLKFLVIDEADRIMDAVFQNWFYHLDSHVRNTSDQLLSGRSAPLCFNELLISSATQPHKLLFSATLSQDPEKLQNMRLFQPKLFTSVITDLKVLREHFTTKINETAQQDEAQTGEFIGKYTTPAELTEKYCITENNLKPLTLYSLIKEQGWTKFLCFTNSNDAANRLAFVLQKLFREKTILELSGGMRHKERLQCLNQFATGKELGLVCSDAMARGIDVEVDVVVSYDAPRHIKTYIHRIGRTARAGRPGTAVTLLTEAEHKQFNRILSEVGKNVSEELVLTTPIEEENANTYSNALKSLRAKLHKEKNQKIWAKRSAKAATLNQFDPANMTLMQKLQVEVDNVMIQNAQTTVESRDKRQKKKEKPKKAKKN